MGNKLEKKQLILFSRLLRGMRPEIARRAKVHVATVNATFEGRSENEDVLVVIRDMLKEQEEKKVNPVILELRQMAEALE